MQKHFDYTVYFSLMLMSASTNLKLNNQLSQTNLGCCVRSLVRFVMGNDQLY